MRFESNWAARVLLVLVVVVGGVPLAAATEPAAFDLAKAKAEVEKHYAAAHPEVQEYILWTAQSFGPGGLWLNEDALSAMTDEERAKRVLYLAELFNDAEYGRHLCRSLAAAGAIEDPRLVPGLIKVAGYHRDDADYDCRAKWMAVAALARQQSDDAVPVSVSLVDHGNQNTRLWARAALARKTGKDFKQDKQAWAAWWQSEGHAPIEAKWLEPSKGFASERR